MDVVIIGAGNVSTVLGRLMVQCGHTVVQVLARNAVQAQSLASELSSVAVSDYSQVTRNASLYMIAVADRAIAPVASALPLTTQLVVHTAGSVNIQVLQHTSSRYGVIYPLQSIRKETVDLPLIPLLVNGSDDQATRELLHFAGTLSTVTGVANDEQRLALHTAAVITSNFTNHLYALAKGFCETHHVSFDYLQPLIEETAARLRHFAPEQMQTGPAIRRDLPTIEKHLHLLNDNPALQQLYQTISNSIASYHS